MTMQAATRAPMRAEKNSAALLMAGRSSPHPFRNRLNRALWAIVYLFLFRCSPKPLHSWRRFLLRAMGARIAANAVIHPSVRIWMPRNLTMGTFACLAPYVDCYNVAPVTIGAGAVVSQYSYLCAATHDYTKVSLPLIPLAIAIGPRAWVCADVFVGPGVTVGEGAVVGARSSVYKDVEPWHVVAGNPARTLKRRVMEA
jgi:putative colanic acid biosynthesis acetyltransferase WcaF